MKINNILSNKFTVSFEFFPPKTEKGEESLFKSFKELKNRRSDFVSVTYGAAGTTRDKTRKIVEKLMKNGELNVMAHLTCINHSKSEIIEILDIYKSLGCQNILAIRGDIPNDINPNELITDFNHTSELIEFIKGNYGDFFSIGGGAFPEKHPESINMDQEMKYFKNKVAAGMEFAITQLFFENSYYYDFLNQMKKFNFDIPIIPGIMPITNYNQLAKFSQMCNSYFPADLVNKVEKYKDDPDSITKIGVEFATQQCIDLIENGAPGIHFYTLNKSSATLEILNNIENYVN